MICKAVFPIEIRVLFFPGARIPKNACASSFNFHGMISELKKLPNYMCMTFVRVLSILEALRYM